MTWNYTQIDHRRKNVSFVTWMTTRRVVLQLVPVICSIWTICQTTIQVLVAFVALVVVLAVVLAVVAGVPSMIDGVAFLLVAVGVGVPLRNDGVGGCRFLHYYDGCLKKKKKYVVVDRHCHCRYHRDYRFF